MTSDAFTLDEPDDFDDTDPGAYLRISRDATPDDLAGLFPDKTPDERAEWLARVREGEGASVTMTVVTEVPSTAVHAWGSEVPVREITGLIIGPPGSERFLRRPVQLDGEHVNCEHDAISYPGGAMICSPAPDRVRPDGARHDAEPVVPEAAELTCLTCAGRLVALVDGGYEHADDADTAACIEHVDGAAGR
jgi:hypothetical protein